MTYKINIKTFNLTTTTITTTTTRLQQKSWQLKSIRSYTNKI